MSITIKKTSWNNFKSIVDSKSLKVQYEESTNWYHLYALDGNYIYSYPLHKDSGADQTDFETNYKSGANQCMTPDIVEESGLRKLSVKATVAAVSEGEIWGWDKYPTGWVILGGTITTDDWVKITIDGYDSQYTIQAGDTWEDVVQGLVNAINNNNDVNEKVDAFSQYKLVFVRAETASDTYEGLTLSTSVSSGATITATRSYETIRKLWKHILVEEDNDDKRYGRIGVFGEVGSRTKAENPIHIAVRKELATKDEIVFADKTIPSEKIWYITNGAVADELAAELRIYHGFERDKVEYFSGDGVEDTFALEKNAICNSDYIEVKVNDVVQELGSDYDLNQNSSDETKTDIVFSSPPSSGTNNIQVTYDSTQFKLGLFVQASASQIFTFGAPIKLVAGEFIVASVVNKSANSGVVIFNVNGFYEDVT